MRILITGAFGFVGRNLSSYLAARGHVLVALDVASQELGAYAEFLTWAELGRVRWRDVDAVIHLAGKAHDTRNTSDPQSYFDVNVGLTEKIIGACLTAGGPKKFVLFSSVKAVADEVTGVLDETVSPAPQTPYGQSKLEAERVVERSFLHYCGSASVEGRERGEDAFKGSRRATHDLADPRTNDLLYYILRPCMIHGPGNKGNLNLLYDLVKRGVPWPLGAFDNRRSFASIGNICAAVAGVLEQDVDSGVFDVADDEALSTNELVDLMAQQMGRPARVVRVPAGMIRLIAKAGDVLHLPLNSERLKKLTESYVVSNAKIKRALGWERMPIAAREGLRLTMASFARYGAKAPSNV